GVAPWGQTLAEMGADRAAALVVLHRGQAFAGAGHPMEAHQFLGEAVRRSKSAGALDGAAIGLVDVGRLWLAAGDQAAARAAFAEALHLARDTGHVNAIAAALDGASSLTAATDPPLGASQLTGVAAEL